jgi:hypothetical protein
MRLLLSRRGKPLAPIVVSRGATETERYAAEELRQHLTQITGAPFEVRETDTLPERAIVVGHGALTERLRPDLSLQADSARRRSPSKAQATTSCLQAVARVGPCTPCTDSYTGWACAGGRRGRAHIPQKARPERTSAEPTRAARVRVPRAVLVPRLRRRLGGPQLRQRTPPRPHQPTRGQNRICRLRAYLLLARTPANLL